MIAGDNDIDDKFFAVINDTGEQLSPLTTALAINLLPVSTTPVNNDRRWQWHRWWIFHRYQRHWWTITAGDNDTGNNFFPRCRWYRWKINKKPKIYQPCQWLSLRIFEKNRNDHNGILRGQGDTDLQKKTWSRKLRVRLPLIIWNMLTNFHAQTITSFLFTVKDEERSLLSVLPFS